MDSQMRRIKPILALGVLLVLAGSLPWSRVSAQSTGSDAASSGAEGSLGTALERLAATAEVSLAYDADLVRGHAATCAVDADAPEATLRCLLAGTGLDFVQTSAGTYVVKADVRKPPKRGAIRGVVREAEGGRPVPQAHVRVAASEDGVVADAGGRFRLSGVVEGPHTLVVSHVGYERRQIDVSVAPGDTVRPTIRLPPTSVAVEPVVVDAPTAEHLAPSREYATLSYDHLAQSTAAGTPSVAHAAGTLMGITTQAPYADLHVQGGATSEHEVRLDGVPVRNPATTGRLLGAFSPLALEGLTARKAGFGALRGNALSGVIELEHDLQREEVRYATAQIDPVSLNGRAEGTASLGETTATVMGAGRMGLWDLHQSYALSSLIDTWSVLDPVLTAAQLAADTSLAGGAFRGKRAQPRSWFYDLHGAARFALGPTQHLSVSAYRGRSMLGTDLVVDPGGNAASGSAGQQDSDTGFSLPTSDRYAWTNTVAQARYETRLSEQATGTVQAALSRYDASSSYEVGRLQWEILGGDSDPAPDFRAQQPSGSRTSNAVMEIGLDGRLALDLEGRDRLTLSGGVTSLGTQVRLENPFAGTVRHTDRVLRLTAAGQAEMGIGSFTTLESSVRLTAHPGRGTAYVEPRAGLRYHRPHTSIGGVSLRIGGGLYRRYTTQFELSRDGTTSVVPTAQVWMPVPEGLAPPRTYHLATDATWSPHSAWTVGMEGYAKWQPHLLAVDYPALQDGGQAGPLQVLSGSRGRAYGGGVHLSYEGAAGASTLRYTYTHARRTFPGRFEDRLVPAPWAEPHRLTLEGRVPIGDVLALDLQGNGIWGRRWGYRRAYYAYLSSDKLQQNRGRPDLGRPADHVLPPLYRVDAGLVATHNWGDVTVTGRIGLVNVFDRANVADWGLRPTDGNSLTRWPRTLPGRRSVVSLKIRY